ncbi:hypothetical protein PO909_028074 [Leuciscus waleckii]
MIVAGFGIFWICRKHRTRDKEITYADPTFYKRNARKLVSFFFYFCVFLCA